MRWTWRWAERTSERAPVGWSFRGPGLAMKILDRYIAKSFLVGYLISCSVLMGLRVVIDLFVNLDEFAKHVDLGMWAVLRNTVTYYGLNMTLYFRDIAGVIIVVAAAFSLGKMVRNNELVAMIASGVSAKRIVTPILILALVFTGLAVADQELVIPAISDKLARSAGDTGTKESYSIAFLMDTNNSLIHSMRYDVDAMSFYRPTIITRRPLPDRPGVYEVTGRISADLATFNPGTGDWDLVHGVFVSTDSAVNPKPVASYHAADLLPKEIAIRRKSGYNSLLSSRQLAALAAQQTKIKDMAQLVSQKHFRITDPIINLTMLMVSLPVLICRDPRTMKSAVLVSFALTAACFLVTFVCKMFATEIVFAGRVMPELWAWLPVFIFMPIAFIELDSMKT
jgi:lipopolysaccharide export system permease protein